MKNLNIVYKNVDELQPYENNPRINDEAVQYVAESIKQFGFKVPIIIDSNNIIVAGHTRLKAAIELGLDSVPCIIADDLTEEQVKEFRLVDNKVNEFAKWDGLKLEEELASLENSLEEFGFITLNDIDYDSFFEDVEQTEKKKKTMVCPYCGKEFEPK